MVAGDLYHKSMSNYIRAFQPGGTFFFTVVSHRRRSFLTDDPARCALHQAIAETRAKYPFQQEAVVLLPDHLHCLWTLPEGDTDFSLRWKVIKLKFARSYLRNGGTEWTMSASRQRRGERGLWQRRFWEHTVRDEREFEILCNYIHYNPVKHGHADCPHGWPYSSFEKFVAQKRYSLDWCCECDGKMILPHERPVLESAIVGE